MACVQAGAHVCQTAHQCRRYRGNRNIVYVVVRLPLVVHLPVVDKLQPANNPHKQGNVERLSGLEGEHNLCMRVQALRSDVFVANVEMQSGKFNQL